MAAGTQPQEEGDPPVDELLYPARYDDEVIAVAATSRNTGGWSGWSNYAEEVDLSAPGEDLISVMFDGTIQPFGGTSGAQPLVAGTAALMKALDSNLVAEDIEGLLEGYATDVHTAGYDVYTGWGRLDAGRAVANILRPYGVEHGISTGASSTTTTDYEAKVIGFTGIDEGTIYYIREYKHSVPVSWSAAFIDSVWCWGMSGGGNGFRKPHLGGHGRFYIHNVPMSYRVSSDINGADFATYAYEVFSDASHSVLEKKIGEPNPANVEPVPM